MPEFIHLTTPTLHDPRLAPYANLRDAELAQRQDPLDAGAHGGLFIAEGDLVLRRLIDSPFTTESVLLAENRVESLRTDLIRLPPATPVFVAPPPLLSALVGFNMHRGVLGIGRRPSTSPAAALAALLALEGPLVVLEDLVNHDNLGGIFRNAAGLGGRGCGILLSPRCADPLYRKSLRVSMGHILTVPFARLEDWIAGLAQVRAAGFKVLALSPDPAGTDLEAVARRRPARVALLLGSEGPGLTDSAVASADERVRISMPADRSGRSIDSLNVAMAAGIALYRLSGRPMGPLTAPSPV